MWFLPLLDITIRISNLPKMAAVIGEIVKLVVIPQCQRPIMDIISTIVKYFDEIVVTLA